MDQEFFESDPASYLRDLLDNEIVSKERMLELLICHITKDDLKDILDTEELSPRFLFSEDEDDGQPDEAQEWHDFDPDC